MLKFVLELVLDSLRLEMCLCGVGVSIIELGKFDVVMICNDLEIVIINDILIVFLFLGI